MPSSWTRHESRRITQFECPNLSEKASRAAAATSPSEAATAGFDRRRALKVVALTAIASFFSKKILEDRRALVLQNAARDLAPVIERVVLE